MDPRYQLYVSFFLSSYNSAERSLKKEITMRMHDDTHSDTLAELCSLNKKYQTRISHIMKRESISGRLETENRLDTISSLKRSLEHILPNAKLLDLGII